MTALIEVKKSSTWYDITDYVISIGLIPYIERNRDYTMSSQPLDISVSTASGISFVTQDPIRITIDSTVRWAGFITTCPNSYDERVWNLSVANDLNKLQAYNVDYSTLHTQLATASTYPDFYVDYSSAQRVGVLYAMKSMFTVAGLTLDISGVQDVTTSNDAPDGTISVPYKAFYLWEEQLYCINQSIATSHTAIDDITQNYFQSKINCYDFVSEILSGFGFGLMMTGLSSYKLIEPTANYSPADDDKYSYISESINGLEPNVYVSFYNGYYADFTSGSIGTLPPPQNDGAAKTSLFWYNNLGIKFSNPITGATDFSVGGLRPYADASTTHSGETYLNVTAKKYTASATNYTKETITKPYDLTQKTVVQNFIDLEKQESQIIQESY